MVEDRLREVIKDIRKKPYPIADLIPLLQEAADEIEKLRKAQEK